MEQGLQPLIAKGWRLTWQAVRRRLNKAADALATLGVFWADRLRQEGHTAVASWILWHEGPPSEPPHAFPVPNLTSIPIQDFPGSGRRARGRCSKAC